MTKPKRDGKPKGALRCAICPLAEAEERLALLNEAAKDGLEWRQDKATRRARTLADKGNAHLCQFAKEAPKKKPAKKKAADTNKDAGKPNDPNGKPDDATS